MNAGDAIQFIFLFAVCALVGWFATAMGGIGGWWFATGSIAMIALLFANIELFYKED